MTLGMTANIVTIILCLAVIVQASRMMRQLRRIKTGSLSDVVASLDDATGKAARVLAELKQTLSGEGVAMARTLAQGSEMREELTVLIGIANAMAERLVEAGQARGESEAAPAPYTHTSYEDAA